MWHGTGPPAQCLQERTQGWWEVLHLTISCNWTDQYVNLYQLGGVAILSCNKIAHQVASTRQDATSLGQFCWTTYQGKDQILLQIVTRYRPSNSSNRHILVLQQHWWYLINSNWTNQNTLELHSGWTSAQFCKNEPQKKITSLWALDANEDIRNPDKQLGNPNRRQTWLEELAEAQAQAMGMTPKKIETVTLDWRLKKSKLVILCRGQWTCQSDHNRQQKANITQKKGSKPACLEES